MWAPMTGPISETKSGLGAHHLAAALDQPLSALRVPDVLDDPGVVAHVLELVRVLDEPFEHALAGSHPLDRRDLVLERQDRLDLQRRAHPGPRARRSGRPCAGTRACRSRTTSAAARGPRRPARRSARASSPPSTAAAAAEDQHAHPAASRAAVDHVDPFTAAALFDQPLPRLQSRFVGAGDPGGEVDRDDRPARVQQRPVDLDEVADRRLRGRRALVARRGGARRTRRSRRSRARGAARRRARRTG